MWTEYGFLPPTVVRVTQGGNRTTLRLTTRLWYNGQYQLITRQDPAGLIWEWNYDSDGKLLWSKELNGAQTTYIYYAGTDRVWKITDALNHTWEYSYTANYHDVKSVKDPEGAITTYEYDYELNEPAYGKVRKVIDPMGRATQYEYYPASDANLARRGQLKKVIAPGGFWRELDYGGAGWLTRRTVQTGANESETTTYTYDSWGRLRLIDYPRSADVQMGYDGENRRVWVQDSVGRREYTYDAWGRVTRQQGCCSNQAGISVVAVEGSYDPAGRRRAIRELTEGNFVLRAIATNYDDLGRVQEISSEGRSVVYAYDTAGRLRQERYPNGIVVGYAYYGTEESNQKGFLKAIGFGFRDCDDLARHVLLRYEYRYVCGVGCGRLPLRVYRQEAGWWVSYEWYTRLLRSVGYSGYEFESIATWLNTDYPLLSGHLLVADNWLGLPWMVELIYDRFGVYIGQRFYPQKVKRWAHYLKEPSDMPPSLYLPPYEPPNTNPGDYESPLPGPWDDFKEAIDCSDKTLDADEICRPPLEYYDKYLEWCQNHPYCVGNTLCCHQRCIEHVTGHRWDEFVWRWIEFYEDVIERVPKRCVKIR